MMELQQLNEILRVSNLGNLSGPCARIALRQVAEHVSPKLEVIELDLTHTKIMDGCGLGALMALVQEANELRNGTGVAIHLLNPTPAIQQLLELTRMRQFFEIKVPADPIAKAGKQHPNRALHDLEAATSVAEPSQPATRSATPEPKQTEPFELQPSTATVETRH